jgi:DNA-directed RNA polymerase subunit M/transcription elongation factor TFIIS
MRKTDLKIAALPRRRKPGNGDITVNPDVNINTGYEQLSVLYPKEYVKITSLPYWNIYNTNPYMVKELLYLATNDLLEKVNLSAETTVDDIFYHSSLQDENKILLQTEYSNLNEEEEGISRTDVKCPKCGKNKINQRLTGGRSGDEGGTYKFNCLNKDCLAIFFQRV